jgi:hypothetical protein
MFCDALDGPLVALARKALETGNANHVLPWVRPENENEARDAFEHALKARRLGGLAAELADRHFFETLVRLHRAWEGAPYCGLRPAGESPGPVMPAAESALETGLVKSLAGLLTEAVRSGLHRHFEAATARKAFSVNDIEAGRRYVEAYEAYVHYVEGLWRAATAAPAPPSEAPLARSHPASHE